jgi:hypothetical protein
MVATGAASPSSTPLHYAIDAAAGVVVIELRSITNCPALLEALRAIRSDPSFHASLDIYVDCNALRGIPSSEHVKQLARLCVSCPRTEAASRWALIATWRPINEAARFFATLIAAPNVALRVFEAWSDARVWLAATRPDTGIDTPWIGPSRALNELMRRSRAANR